MPAYYDLPESFGNASVEDIAKFNQLPFFLVMNELKLFPRWNVWDTLYGTIDWEANMGNTMKAVTPQPSPVGQSFFYPAALTSQPNKNVYETRESTEQAVLYWHRYESKQFYFLPYFTAFWKNQIQYTHADITRQITVSNNLFLRTNIFDKSPRMYIAGYGLVDCPVAASNPARDAANSKTLAWLAAQLPLCKTNFSLAVRHKAQTFAQNDLAIPPFEGLNKGPKDNKGLDVGYVVVDSSESYHNLYTDPLTSTLKSINLDLLFSGFQGSLFGVCTSKFEQYPIRVKVAVDGSVSIPVPELWNPDDNKIYINPDYRNAEFEITFLCGGDAYKSIKIGPPPSEFSSRNMSASKFYSLRWNGEIQLTDQILITQSAGGNITSVELNRYGTNLQFISQTTHGIIAGDPRYVLPILSQRQRLSDIPA